MNLRIGSRASRLAVFQAEWVARELQKATPELQVTFHKITTTGDLNLTSPLSALGGKGVFVKEIEEALLNHTIDLAVHSLKDVPQMLPHGLRLGAVPKREDARDAVLSRFGEMIHELPKGSTIGTSSPRRQAQLLNRFKKRNYHLAPIRGNVETRLKKLRAGEVDAIIMAVAGLNRLGLESEINQILEPSEMLPAPCQGCLGLEMRLEDDAAFQLVEKIKHLPSDHIARAERSFLQALGGNCNVPVGAYSVIQGDSLDMEALLLDSLGEKAIRVVETGPLETPELVGAKLAGRILAEGGAELL